MTHNPKASSNKKLHCIQWHSKIITDEIMNSQLIPTEELSSLDIEAMYLLLSKHFQGVERDVFNADLNHKNWVILIKDSKTNQLKGFSTLLFYNTDFTGEDISIVYSGDTIMDPSAWSSSTLSRTWIDSVNKLRTEYSQGKLYWLLICGGYRTYRFLPIFWQEFYPRYDVATPPDIANFMEYLAQERFGKNYNPISGVVSFSHPHILREGLRGVPQERLTDPHIEFFDRMNPGHLNGDELVCLTEISETNLTPAGKRMWFASVSSSPAIKNSTLRIPA
ncbi:hypothetical protein [Mastigocoleus testarum]|nr:hypothetical protein [Mastigocoleus testarum]